MNRYHEHHHHPHGHSHEHDHGHKDHNLRAAYLHVLTDALTSVTAIVALLSGKYLGWVWMDPVMGIVGAIFIIVWAKKLLRDTSGILLDKSEIDEVQAEISQVMSVAHITNVHVWRIGSEQLAAIISIATSSAEPVEYYKQLLLRNTRLKHVTVEVSTADVVV